MASENGTPAEQKCCKCLQVPTKAIDCDSDKPVYFMVMQDESLSHLVSMPSGDVSYNFKCVNLYYTPQEGETLYCDDCVQEEFDGLTDGEDDL